jgi:hypothetical protein
LDHGRKQAFQNKNSNIMEASGLQGYTFCIHCGKGNIRDQCGPENSGFLLNLIFQWRKDFHSNIKEQNPDEKKI